MRRKLSEGYDNGGGKFTGGWDRGGGGKQAEPEENRLTGRGTKLTGKRFLDLETGPTEKKRQEKNLAPARNA